MTNETETTVVKKAGGKFDWLHVVLLVILAIVAAAGITYWVVTKYLFPSEFEPVTLNAKEEQVLSAKLERLDSLQSSRRSGRRGANASEAPADGGRLAPEKYSEEGASREITLSEKELNALLAKNTDMAKKLAVDLSDDLVSAKLLVHVDEDFPIFAGQVIKVRAGVELAYDNAKPIVMLRGVSVMGVPIPNAWLGGLKNIDLVKEYGGEQGFWKAFSDGVDNIRIEEGQLKIKLKE